jgi:ribosomal protein L13E
MQPEIVHKGNVRKARGYSLQELKDASMDIRLTKKLNVPVDRRRRTAYEENINQLKTKMEAYKRPPKKKPVKGKKRPPKKK